MLVQRTWFAVLSSPFPLFHSLTNQGKWVYLPSTANLEEVILWEGPQVKGFLSFFFFIPAHAPASQVKGFLRTSPPPNIPDCG